MKLEFDALTDIGRVRANNEDAVVIDAAHGLAVLADGMGGYNAGEVASAMAVATISSELAHWLERAADAACVQDVLRAAEICVGSANRKIFDAANANRNWASMGTTLVMAVAHGSALVVGHVGDSRAYRWRSGMLAQLTRDHSVLQEQIEAGLITSEEAICANWSLITRALGVEDTVLLDAQEVPMEPGDVYLLCSDGLTDMLGDADIAAVLQRPQPLGELSRRLIDMANEAGGRDNVSVALIRANQVF
ncbi:MAG: Stp1/IreP family PP2C-type Ser/Thr phosphatase [Desulfovibrionaceae bacterium]|jgi:protein phosphatase|nr:Stp1/IreP family PP2C-type Ser/Thr phosphatase [Desulfovibrionaceae bacterium]